MNYQRIYDQIISRAREEGRAKSSATYYESHHILPKCLGGSNSQKNLVLLTGREHFLCHWMLCRLHPENKKLAFAFWAMSNLRTRDQEKRYMPSSRAYEEAKELHSEAKKAFYKTYEGAVATTKRLLAIDFKTRTANTDYRAKATKIDYEARTANTDWEARAVKQRKSIYQFTKSGILLKEWSSGTEASMSLGISRGDISSCLVGRYKSAGGFIWKYKQKVAE